MSDGSSPFDEFEEADGADFARELTLFDIVVMGAAREGILRRVIFGDIPERVGERFDRRMVMVKKHSPTRSAVRRWARKWVGRRK